MEPFHPLKECMDEHGIMMGDGSSSGEDGEDEELKTNE